MFKKFFGKIPLSQANVPIIGKRITAKFPIKKKRFNDIEVRVPRLTMPVV